MRHFAKKGGTASTERKLTARFSPEDGSNGFEVDYEEHTFGRFLIFLDDAIEHPSQFRRAIRALDAADQNTPVVIYLQSPGGSLDATDSFIHAMRKCRGPIHIVATGNCSSASSFILLEADSIELSEGFSSLLHCGSLGSGGNYNEYSAKTGFDNKFLPRFFREAYRHFLTEQELDDLLKGVDIWLDAEGFLERWERRNEALEAEVLEEAADEAFEEVIAE